MNEDDVVELLRQYVSMSQKSWTESELLRVGVFSSYPDAVRRFLSEAHE